MFIYIFKLIFLNITYKSQDKTLNKVDLEKNLRKFYRIFLLSHRINEIEEEKKLGLK